MTTRHIMLDIETWDTSPTSIVRAIAVINFSSNSSIRDEFLIDCRHTTDEQILAGRTICEDTVAWWNQQSDLSKMLDAHRDKLRNFHTPTSLVKLADVIGLAMHNPDCEAAVWQRGANFDTDIIKDLLLAADRMTPWRYSRLRDVRTLDEIVPKVESAVPHDPLEDCRAQVKQVLQVLELAGKLNDETHNKRKPNEQNP